MDQYLEAVELRALVALILGMVIGAEREQRMAAAEARRPAGIRTFAIAALLGVVAHLLDHPVALALFGGAVAIGALAAYALGDRSDPGLTTELALVLTFGLGALAMSRPMLALAIAIVTALLLAFRSTIHSAVIDLLRPAELRDALIVAAAALVILPLVPDRVVDPWGVLNPFVLWRLVVVVLSIHLASHVAQRVLGPRWGLAVAGLASGFVSSSATIAAMGSKVKEDAARLPGAIAAATSSNVSTFAQLALLVGTASPALLRELAIPLAAGGGAAAAYALYFALRATREREPSETPGRAVDLKGAVIFAALVTAVAIGATLVERAAGRAGVVVAAAVAAFADAHAAAASIASLHAADRLEDGAILAVLACLTTNTITKSVLAFTSGPRAYARPVFAGLVLMLGATWAAWAALAVLGAE